MRGNRDGNRVQGRRDRCLSWGIGHGDGGEVKRQQKTSLKLAEDRSATPVLL